MIDYTKHRIRRRRLHNPSRHIVVEDQSNFDDAPYTRLRRIAYILTMMTIETNVH